tara:strand:+ start:323 stop:742 length:420 start_codon:yes stop_codon:yes gene_type:complete
MTDIDNMENMLGKWVLKENSNFTKFLSFTQLPWYQIQIANYSTIDLYLSKKGPMHYFKKVESIFYNVNHDIHINNEFKQCKDGKKIKYQLVDNKIVTDIMGTIVNWQEIISFEDPNLKIEYKWDEDGESKRASQIFESK